jgi:hypothetical protein
LSETICSIRTQFWWNSHWMVLFQNCVHRFGPSTKMASTAELSEDHPRIISAKFGWNWLSSFTGEDFFLFSSPFFLICIIDQNRQKFKVHTKSCNIY